MIRAGMLSKTHFWFAMRCGLTVAVLVILWRTAGGGAIAETLVRASPFWLMAAVATLMLQTALSAQRWRLTAAQLGQTLPRGYALKEYFLSQAFNQALPGAVAGDAARAVRARDQGGLLVAGQAVFFERLAGQIAMFLTLAVAFLSTLLVAGGLDWPPALCATLVTVVCIGLALPLSVLGVGLFAGELAAKALRWLRPLGVALFTSRVLPRQILFGVAITLCNLAAFGFAARAVGVDLSLIEIMALVPVILFAMLIPLTVSGWGVREGAAALFLPIAGISATDSVAASVMFGLALLIAVIPGALMVMAR